MVAREGLSFVTSCAAILGAPVILAVRRRRGVRSPPPTLADACRDACSPTRACGRIGSGAARCGSPLATTPRRRKRISDLARPTALTRLTNWPKQAQH